MTMIRKSISMMLVMLLALAGFPSVSLAQSQAACDAAIEKIERETQQLGRDVNADVREFVKNDVVDTSLAGIRNHYKNKPASEAVFDLKDKWDKFNTYAEYIKNARVTTDDLIKCINTRGCSIFEFAKRQNEAIAKWIQSLGEEGLSAASERATKAGSILRNYVEKTLNTGVNGAMDTVTKCNANFERQANTNTSNTSPNQNTPPANSGGGGGGAGKAILGIIGAGAVGVGTYVALSGLDESLTSTGGTSTGGGTTTSSSNGTYAATVTRSCTLGSANSNPLSPSFIEPCTNAINTGGSCGPLGFTFTVSGSSIQDCGGWLANGSVSGGQVSARYDGVCGLGGIPVSGSLTGGTLSGSGTCRGNNYTVTISVRRQ